MPGLLTQWALGKLSDKKKGDNSSAPDDSASPSTFKKGGLVKKTGQAKVHKGERVLTKQQNKRYAKSRGK